MMAEGTFVDSLSEGFVSFAPDEGHKIAIAELTVKNNGTKTDDFLPAFAVGNEDVRVKPIYDEKFEFNFTNFLGLSGQLHMETLNPLSSKTGTILFEVAEEVAQSDKPLHLKFFLKNKEYVFDVRS